MKKKKFFSYMLMGLLAVGATGTVTSCKDYDDDINAANKRIDEVNTALEQCKSNCETSIASLKTQLEQQDAYAKSLNTALQTLQTTVGTQGTDIATLKSQLQTVSNTLSSVQETANTNKTDIATNKTNIAANKAAIDGLLERMTAAEAKGEQNAELIASAQKAIDDVKASLEQEVQDRVADVAALTAKINKLNDAVDEINTVLADKVDKDVYNATVADIYAKLKTVDETLADQLTQIQGNTADIKQLKTDLGNLATTVKTLSEALDLQKQALENYKEEVAKTYATIESLNDNVKTINGKIDDLQKQIDELGIADIAGLQDALDGKANLADFNKVKAIAEANSEAISKINTHLDVIDVFISKALRSLVFVPDAYYYGIEATPIKVLNYWKFKNVPVAAWNVKEAKGYTDHVRYDSVSAERVMNFVANYHMNPSSADPDLFGDVTVVTDDKPYVTDTRAADAAPFTVVSKSVKDGILTANINVKDPTKIKTVSNDAAVTVFALQVNTNKDGQDTTITSDYATLYKKTVKNLKLFHTAGTGVPFVKDTQNTHDPSPALDGKDKNHAHNNVLMQTAHEAGWDFAAQDTVMWNETFDLSKLVEVHYTDVDGKNYLMTSTELEANGLSYKFELTGLYFGNNETSESAHAAIAEDGVTFRPQMPEYDDNHVGKQQAYGATQDRQEIGRTPLVRVELVDADGNILDYGYIRIRIAEKGKEVKPDENVSYTGPGWTYNGECNPKAWSYKTRWIQTEYDLYNKLGLSRAEFEANYTAEENNGALQQYKLKSDGKTFEKVADTDSIGKIVEHEETTGEQAAQTQVLEWNISGNKMKEIFYTNKQTSAQRAIKYVSADKTVGPDVYVVFNVGTPITLTTPSAVANLDANKIEKLWYVTNTATLGKNEVHANTLNPEDELAQTADTLDDQFSDLFVGNLKTPAPYIGTINNLLADNKDYEKSEMTLDFQFDKSNESRTAKGIRNGVEETYNFVVADNGKTLKAYKVGEAVANAQVVAKIEGATADVQKVVYQHSADDNGYAEAMLNYKAHNELADDVINVAIGMYAQNKCGFDVPLTENTFDVRFLRPLNVFDNKAEVEDAATELQTINVVDLVKFTDWRDQWDGKAGAGAYTANAGYTKYYDIKSITIPGIDDGDNLADQELVKTNLNGSEQSLSKVSDQVDFTYNQGVITYRNLSSTVHDFYVIVPVEVHYIWGTVYQNVTINVKKSLNNAKKF